MEILAGIFQSSLILGSVTILTLIIGTCLMGFKNLVSQRVEWPMILLVLFWLIGLPFLHIQFSYTAATVMVLIMMLLLNSWVIYTMYKEQVANDINTEKGV